MITDDWAAEITQGILLCMTSPDFPSVDVAEALRDAKADAIAATIERCAVIAELTLIEGQSTILLRMKIAAAIRATSDPTNLTKERR